MLIVSGQFVGLGILNEGLCLLVQQVHTYVRTYPNLYVRGDRIDFTKGQTTVVGPRIFHILQIIDSDDDLW